MVDNATIKMKRIAIFASGSGTNALNIINYFNGNAGNGAVVALVVCNRKDAGIVSKAEAVGVPVLVMPRNDINDEKLMLSVLEQYKVDIIALAGFLLMVPSFIIERYEGKIVNIHPSLLPKFGGERDVWSKCSPCSCRVRRKKRLASPFTTSASIATAVR